MKGTFSCFYECPMSVLFIQVWLYYRCILQTRFTLLTKNIYSTSCFLFIAPDKTSQLFSSCGTPSSPIHYSTTQRYLRVEIQTDSSVVKSGFKLEYLAAKNYGTFCFHSFYIFHIYCSHQIIIEKCMLFLYTSYVSTAIGETKKDNIIRAPFTARMVFKFTSKGSHKENKDYISNWENNLNINMWIAKTSIHTNINQSKKTSIKRDRITWIQTKVKLGVFKVNLRCSIHDKKSMKIPKG